MQCWDNDADTDETVSVNTGSAYFDIDSDDIEWGYEALDE
jgi:hypothetical protein